MTPAPPDPPRVGGSLARLAWGAVAADCAAVGALAWALVALGGLGQALLTSAVVPDLDLLGQMVFASAGSAVGLALPLGVVGGVVSGTRRFADEGAWLGLRAVGVGGRALAAPILAFAVLSALAWLLVGHVVEPASRSGLRQARVAAASRVRPVEGKPVSLGRWTAVLDAGVLRFAGGDWLGTAEEWHIVPATTGVIVQLGHAELVRTDGAERARFERLEVPIPLAGGSGKVHASERTTADLARQIALSAALGRDRYERWILWKRNILPACLVLLAVAGVPFGLERRRPVLAVAGTMVLSVWGAVRVADQGIEVTGLVGAAAIVFAVALAWVGGAWAGWRDA